MARVTRLEKHRILADLIEKWARGHGLLGDPYLEKLTHALRTNENLAMWAAIDPFELLPYPIANSGNKMRNYATIASNIRNGLVFFPVGFTWLAISKATSAFEKFVNENVTTTVNFLEFWQNGYDILDPKWRISNVGLTDAIIVFIIIILNVASGYFAAKSIQLNRIEDQELAHDRLELTIAIKEYLFTKQTVTKLSINQGLATAVENLVITTEKLQRRRR
jgi:hypothetical protein